MKAIALRFASLSSAQSAPSNDANDKAVSALKPAAVTNSNVYVAVVFSLSGLFFLAIPFDRVKL